MKANTFFQFGGGTDVKSDFPKYSQLTLVSATMPQFVEEFLENIIDVGLKFKFF